MTNSDAIRRSIIRLRKVGSPTFLTLGLLITLLIVVLRIEKVISWPTLSLMPANRPVTSVESLGNILQSEL